MDCECITCVKGFQFSHGRYAGKYFRALDTMVCNACLVLNHDGFVPTTNPRLVARWLH
jgi:hypothetical protein